MSLYEIFGTSMKVQCLQRKSTLVVSVQRVRFNFIECLDEWTPLYTSCPPSRDVRGDIWHNIGLIKLICCVWQWC